MRLAHVFPMLLTVVFGWAACRSLTVTPPSPSDAGAGGAPAPEPGTGGTPAPEPPVDVDAGVELDPCERACERLTELGCEEARPTDEGASCVDVCRNVEGSGVVSLDPECVAELVRCDDVDGCIATTAP